MLRICTLYLSTTNFIWTYFLALLIVKKMLNITLFHSPMCMTSLTCSSSASQKDDNKTKHGWRRGTARRARDLQAVFEVQRVETFWLLQKGRCPLQRPADKIQQQHDQSFHDYTETPILLLYRFIFKMKEKQVLKLGWLDIPVCPGLSWFQAGCPESNICKTLKCPHSNVFKSHYQIVPVFTTMKIMITISYTHSLICAHEISIEWASTAHPTAVFN